MATLMKNNDNCGVMADWCKANGKWLGWDVIPEPGDVVFFDFSGKHKIRQHVGFVERTSESGATIYTIEGNTAIDNDDNGGEVMRRTRFAEQIVGYYRPAWESTAQRDAILARARGEIGVQESPANSNNVKYNTWMYGEEVSGSNYAWCANFVCWVFNGPETESAVAVKYGAKMKNLPFHELYMGCRGPEVRHVQRIIYARGIDRTMSVDGKFGAKTKKGVIELQKQLFPEDSAEWDGIVGEKTFTAMVTALV